MRDAVLAAHQLSGVDGVYTFYYDETNNVRKLHLTPEGMNIRRPDCFVLGGVVHSGPTRPIELAGLRTLLRLQPSLKEIKLKHLGSGDFLGLLASGKIESFLDWLTTQGFLIHYQVTDLLYWSIVDIVDSIVTEIGEPQLMAAHLLLKDSLYAVLREDVDGTAELLGRYRYPAVGRERRAAFIAELLELVGCHEYKLKHFSYYMLKGVLQAAREIPSLPYLEDETPNVLIDGFGSFVSNRLCLFKNAYHVLDDEPQIEAYLTSLELSDGEVPLRHFRFVSSHSEPGVQLADPVVGLLGKLFTFLNRTPMGALHQEMNGLSDQQRRSLAMLSRLLDKSTNQCLGFAQYVISAEDRHRTHFVLDASMPDF